MTWAEALPPLYDRGGDYSPSLRPSPESSRTTHSTRHGRLVETRRLHPFSTVSLDRRGPTLFPQIMLKFNV
jgi:hypothetical protein